MENLPATQNSSQKTAQRRNNYKRYDHKCYLARAHHLEAKN